MRPARSGARARSKPYRQDREPRSFREPGAADRAAPGTSVTLGRPRHLASGLLKRAGDFGVAALDYVRDLEQIIWPGAALRLRMADIEVGNELVLAGAEIRAVRHQRHLGRKMVALEEFGHLDRLEGFRAVGRERAGPGPREAEPGARGRHATGLLLDGGDELRDVRHARLIPVPLEHPGADARLGRQALERLELALGAGEMEALFEAELHGLLERVHLVVALNQEDDDVGLRRLGLDQVGGEVGGAERRQIAADAGAAELRCRLD